MADGIVQVQPDSTGKKVDTTEITVGANTVERQRIQLAGSLAAALADVLNAVPTGSEYGLVTRPIDADVSSTGTIAALNQTVELDLVGGKASVSVQISGTFVGNLVFEAIGKHATQWFQVTGFGALSGLTFQQTGVTGGNFTFMVGGFRKIRVRADTTWTSGTATIDLQAGSGPVGNQFANVRIQDPTSGGPIAFVDPLFDALRVSPRPPEILGAYRYSGQTGIYTALGAGAILFSARWGDATRFALITRVTVRVNTTTAATAAGMIDRDLVVVRSFSASDTGQTAVTLTGNNQKTRTSHGTSLFTDMRIANTSNIAAGTGTADTQAVGLAGKQGTATEPVGLTIAPEDLFVYDVGRNHPIVLAQNEGFRIRIPTAMPTAIAQRTLVTVEWLEVAAF